MELTDDVHLKNFTENVDNEKIRSCGVNRVDLESMVIVAEEAEGSIDSNQMKEIIVVGDSVEMEDEIQKHQKTHSKKIVENILIDGDLKVESVSQVSSSEDKEKVRDLKTTSETTTNELNDQIDSVSNSEIVSENYKSDKIMNENIAVDSKVPNDSENNLIVKTAKEKSSNNKAKVVSLELLGDSEKKSIQIDCDSGFEFSSIETSISYVSSVQNVSFELSSSSLDKTKNNLSDFTACVSTTESNLENINTDYESPDKLTRTLLAETSNLLKLQTNIKKSSKNESILCEESTVSNADIKTDAIENEVVPFNCRNNDDPNTADDFAYESEVYEEVEAASDCESGEDKYSRESGNAVDNSSEETHHTDKMRKVSLHTADKYIEESLHIVDESGDNSLHTIDKSNTELLHTVDKSGEELFHTIDKSRDESLYINKSNDEPLQTVDKSNDKSSGQSLCTISKPSDELVLKSESLSFVAVIKEINDNIKMTEHSSIKEISNIKKDVPEEDITEDLLILSEAEDSEGEISDAVHEANAVMNEEESKDINHSHEKSDFLKQDCDFASDSDFDLDDDAIMGLEKDVSSSPVIQKNILQGNLVEKISQELPVVPDTLSKIKSTDSPSKKKAKDFIPVLCLDSDDDLKLENIGDLSSDDDCCIVEDTRNEVVITDEEKATQAEIVPYSVQQEKKDMSSNNKPDSAKKSNENVSFTQSKSIEPMSRGQKRKLSTEQSTVLPVSLIKQPIIEESQVTVSSLLASMVGEVDNNKNKVTSSNQVCVEEETVNNTILNSERKEYTDINNSNNNVSSIDNDIIVETVIKKKSDPTELISSTSENKSIKRASSEILLSPEAISSKRSKENESISSSVSNLLNITNMPNLLKSKTSSKVPLADPFMIQTKKSYLDKIAFHLCKTTLDGLYSSEIDYAKKITRDLEEKLHLLKVRCQPLKEQMAVLCRSQHKIAQEHGLILQKPIRTVGIQVSIKLEVTVTDKSHEPLSNCKPMTPKAPPVESTTSCTSTELQPQTAQTLSLIQTSPTTMSQPPRLVVKSAYRPQTPILTARATFGNVISPNVTMTGNPLSAVMRSMSPTTTLSNRGRPTNASRALARLPAVIRPNTYAPANQQNVLISPNNQQNVLLSTANAAKCQQNVQQNVLVSSGNQQNFLVPISSLLQLNGTGVQNNRPTIVSSLPQNFLGKTVFFSPRPLNNNRPILQQGTSPQMQTLYLRVTNPNQAAGLNNVINTVPRAAATTTSFVKYPRAATAPNSGPRPRTAPVTLHNPGVRPRTAPVTAQNPGLVLYPQHAIKHPAPFQRPPMYSQNPMLKDMPPPPTLSGSIAPNNGGIVLSWTMPVSPRGYAEVATYQLYAYQENPRLPISSSLWKKVGDVKALPLPMACTLTQFVEGNRYYFTVRAIDVHTRIGRNSEPVSILFSKDDS